MATAIRNAGCSRGISPAGGAKEGEMPEFMDVHDGFVGVTQEQVDAAHQADLAVEGEEGVHFKHWWADPVSGKVFCLSVGPSKDAVLRVHEKAGHPTDQIWEVGLNGE